MFFGDGLAFEEFLGSSGPKFEGFGIGFGDGNGCLGFSFCLEDLRLSLPFRLENFRLFVSLVFGNLRLFVSFCLENEGTFIPFSLHLFTHRILNIFGWFELLDFDTHHLDSPFASFTIERFEEFGIDSLTIGESLIECHGSENTSETRLCEIHDCHENIGYLILCLDRIGNLDIHDPIDRHSDIITSDNLLFWNGNHLFSDIDFTECLNPWDEEDNSWTDRIGVSTEELSESQFSLTNLLNKHRYDYCKYNEQYNKSISIHKKVD